MSSIRHHYVPVFYTKRWANSAKSKLVQYSRPWGNVVKPNRVAPAGTGYVDRLYELHGFEPELAQQIEENFFKPVDNAAAQALELMERDGNNAVWNSRLRSGWTTFLLSLLLRCPEDLAIFEKEFLSELASSNEEWDAKYADAKSPGDPDDIGTYFDQQPQAWKSMAVWDALMPLVAHERLGHFINHMHWRVFDIPPGTRDLLTSDRPLIRTNALDHKDSHIALAIGPRRLFVAAKEAELIRRVYTMRPKITVEEYNRQVVGGAVKYVYSTDDRSLRFVQNRMGAEPQPRLMESLAKRIDDRIAGLSEA